MRAPTAEREVRSPGNGGVYVYGVVPAGVVPESLPDRGLGDVRTLQADDLAALVSDVDTTELHGRRRELAAHTQVLDVALQHGPVLPMRFGTVLADDDAVERELLVGRGEALDEWLARIEGRVQMSVRVVLDEQAVLARVVASDPRLARLAAEQRGRSAPQAARLRLGEAVARAYQRFSAELGEQLLPALSARAEDVVREAPRSTDEALVASFLVADADVDAFLTDADGVGEALDGLARVRVTGPMPVYAFVPAEVGVRGEAWA